MIQSELCGALTCFTEAGQGADPLRHNLGYHVGDDPHRVTAERSALSTQLGHPIIWMDQTHSTVVRLLRLDATHPGSVRFSDGEAFDAILISPTHHIPADGLILDAREARALPLPAVAVMTADCLPVLLSDTTGRVVAAVHAGRVGLENGILLNTLERYAALGIPAGDIHAMIGPAICGDCYEVPEAMAQAAEEKLEAVRSTTCWTTPGLDLPTAAQRQLQGSGLAAVHTMGECTYENPNFHSYRRASNAGRQASIISPRPLV